jgi:hypothetical protein
VKKITLLGAALALLACSAKAQMTQEKPQLFAASSPDPGALASFSGVFAALSPAAGRAIEAPGALSPSIPPAAEPAVPPQSVQGVFPNSDWQAYIGYTFLRFYVVPGSEVNNNGFDGSLAYYYRGGWFGGEGELVGAFGSLSGQTSNFFLGAGGPKIRWSAPGGTDLWAHALVGGANFSPQTIYGKEAALAYELGAGIDIASRHQRIAYRIEADAVGTRFFGTYQYSPKISVGVVYRF